MEIIGIYKVDIKVFTVCIICISSGWHCKGFTDAVHTLCNWDFVTVWFLLILFYFISFVTHHCFVLFLYCIILLPNVFFIFLLTLTYWFYIFLFELYWGQVVILWKCFKFSGCDSFIYFCWVVKRGYQESIDDLY